MSLKDFLIKKLSLRLNTSARIIETVISHQFTSAFQATSTHNSIEISGFGKFTFSQVKAKNLMEKYIATNALYTWELENPDTTPERRKNLMARMVTLKKSMEHLKPKLHEPKSNIRGMEE